MSHRWCALLAIGVVAFLNGRAAAVEDISTEEDVADLLVTPAKVEETGAAGRRWAVVPLIGYGKRTGGLLGLKYTDRDTLGTGLTLDLRAAYTMNAQTRFVVGVGDPDVGGGKYLWSLRAAYENDPQYLFYALGTNDIGPDPITTHSRRRVLGQALFGWRPVPSLALNATAAFRHYDIGRGDRDDRIPFTGEFFPQLPGVKGGFTTPLAVSAVLNTRNDLLRPSRGWRVIARAVWDPPGGGFEFGRFVLDAGYLYPLSERQVIGARVNGGIVVGPRPDVPFWELEAAGGDDSLRGYLSDQFLGNGRLFLDTEYRVRLFSFDFFDVWRVGVFGALFFDVGGVLIFESDIRKDLAPHADVVIGSLRHAPVFGGGPGIRFALSQALVARVDVAFSPERLPIIYLAFGHTF